MRKNLTLLITLLFVCSLSIEADEGMWMLPYLEKLNIERMRELGLELDADDIYNINRSSLKDAVVIFGGGCTGEMISDRGLLLTNHHCGYSVIQSHSTIENDYLSDGFWAASPDQEIPSPGLSVVFLVRIEDVTDSILDQLDPDLGEAERSIMINLLSRRLEREATQETHYFARVQPFFGGNRYYMMVYERFTDVRLAGTPPSSIGKYGGDTDNWMWPRHTGDFALFRVYSGPDGLPADYSEDNIPVRPKHHLPVSMRGVEPGDFAMVLGYPGGTTRYMTSYEVDDVLRITHPNRIKIRGLRQDILIEDMLASDKVRIQYANKYSNSSNYWKFSIGQSEVLERLGIYDRKKTIEQEFREWMANDRERSIQYGDALGLIERAVISRRDYSHAIQYINEAILRSCEIVTMANRANNLQRLLAEGSAGQQEIAGAVETLSNAAGSFYRDYNPPTDRKVVAAMLELFYADVDTEYHPTVLSGIYEQYEGDFEAYAAHLFDNSVFASEQCLMDFLEDPISGVLDNDPALMLARSTFEKLGELREASQEYSHDMSRGQRLFMAGLMEMHPDSTFYPDANFSMRLTYGTAGGYNPRNAVWYDHITTLDGVMEKEDPDHHEFVVPERLRELYSERDYGHYGVNGLMPVNFITNNDITGGNSGSPVINARGELTGLVFDGNWEAMSGDIAFEPELQRSIAVDIRYILFIIDKYAGASHFIEEMTIVN